MKKRKASGGQRQRGRGFTSNNNVNTATTATATATATATTASNSERFNNEQIEGNEEVHAQQVLLVNDHPNNNTNSYLSALTATTTIPTTESTSQQQNCTQGSIIVTPLDKLWEKIMKDIITMVPCKQSFKNKNLSLPPARIKTIMKNELYVLQELEKDRRNEARITATSTTSTTTSTTTTTSPDATNTTAYNNNNTNQEDCKDVTITDDVLKTELLDHDNKTNENTDHRTHTAVLPVVPTTDSVHEKDNVSSTNNDNSNNNNNKKCMISSEAPVLMIRACELLVQELSVRAWRYTEISRRRTVQRLDVYGAVCESDTFDFLIDIVPRVPIILDDTISKINSNSNSNSNININSNISSISISISNSSSNILNHANTEMDVDVPGTLSIPPLVPTATTIMLPPPPPPPATAAAPLMMMMIPQQLEQQQQRQQQPQQQQPQQHQQQHHPQFYHQFLTHCQPPSCIGDGQGVVFVQQPQPPQTQQPQTQTQQQEYQPQPQNQNQMVVEGAGAPIQQLVLTSPSTLLTNVITQNQPIMVFHPNPNPTTNNTDDNNITATTMTTMTTRTSPPLPPPYPAAAAAADTTMMMVPTGFITTTNANCGTATNLSTSMTSMNPCTYPIMHYQLQPQPQQQLQQQQQQQQQQQHQQQQQQQQNQTFVATTSLPPQEQQQQVQQQQMFSGNTQNMQDQLMLFQQQYYAHNTNINTNNDQRNTNLHQICTTNIPTGGVVVPFTEDIGNSNHNNDFLVGNYEVEQKQIADSNNNDIMTG